LESKLEGAQASPLLEPSTAPPSDEES
jgi:hypothetical protein